MIRDIIYGGTANSLSIFLPCPTAIDLPPPPSPLLSFNLLATAAADRRNSFPSSVSAAAIKNAAGDRPARPNGAEEQQRENIYESSDASTKEERVQCSMSYSYAYVFPHLQRDNDVESVNEGGTERGGGDALNVSRLVQS